MHVLAGYDRGIVLSETAADLRRVLPRLWDAGWQPAELVREARRVGARIGRLVMAAVLADHVDRDPSTLHTRWAEQVEELAAVDPVAKAAATSRHWMAAFADREGLVGRDLASTLVDALAACFGLGPLAVILPPPGDATGPATGAVNRTRMRNGADDPVLAKVRALLAQAESTTFEAEAAAFTAKAQELMARHAIDVALVWEDAGREEQPITIRLSLDDPYVDAKSLLLHVVAKHSRCRAVLHERYAMSSVVGFESDVAATEVLFTSLLVQSQVAMRAEAAAAGPGSRVRSRSFRSSFLLAYARRIDERLDAVNRIVESDAGEAHGRSLLPVLAARDDAVDDAVRDLFGELRSAPVRGARDPLGWARGALAADRAELTAGGLGTNATALPHAKPA